MQRSVLTASFELAADQTIAVWTSQAEDLWGWSAGEMLGRPVGQLVPERNQERQRKSLRALLDAPHTTVSRDVTGEHKDGREFRVTLTASVDQTRDEPRILVAAVGVTPAEWAESAFNSNVDRYRMILDQMGDGCSVVDLWGNYLFVNAAYCEMFGIPSRDRALGTNFREYFSGDLLPMMQRVHADVFRTGEPVQGYEFTLARDDELRCIEMSVSIERNARGEPIGFTGISRDRTMRARAERELAEAKLAAEAANRAKSEFLAHMSHEIRTPMNGIIGMSELALGTELTDVQRDYLTTVQGSADALLVLINDILDFSKIEAGKLEIDRVDFSLRALLDQVVKPLAFRAHAKSLDLLVDIRADVPDHLVGDPHRLRQVLVNLIGNAIKFTEEGEVFVDVAARVTGGQVQLHVSVIDTGIGIPQGKRAAIFQAFTQADGSTTRRHGGSGLGLTISRQLVSLMGGRIWVDGSPSGGSAFQFEVTLPVATVAPTPPYLVSEKELAGLSVLVVDDNATGLRITAETLTRWGMSVVTAMDAASAVAAVSRAPHGFNMAVLDMNLPDATGVTLTRSIRQHPNGRTMAVVVMTSSDHAREERDVAALGNARYLVKPAGQRALLETLLAIVGSRTIAPPAPAAADVTPLRSAQALRVLVAEDNAVNRALAEHLLLRRGHQPTLVENGREAVTAVASGGYDLVLMDLQMPEMDGFGATAAIRSTEAAGRARMPIIALTAHAMEGDRQRCLDAGMDGYVSKPIRAVELFEVIDRVISSAAASDSSATPIHQNRATL